LGFGSEGQDAFSDLAIGDLAIGVARRYATIEITQSQITKSAN
jgi:hypothetical protein